MCLIFPVFVAATHYLWQKLLAALIMTGQAFSSPECGKKVAPGYFANL